MTKAQNTSKSKANGAEQALQAVADAAETVTKTVRAQSSDVADTARSVASDGSDQLTTAHNNVRQAVKDNPTLALGAALGLGVLIGLTLRQSKS